MPDNVCKMEIVVTELGKDRKVKVEWHPFEKANYNEGKMPSTGYLGTAYETTERGIKIGYHAWRQNDSEFIYFKII